MRRLLPALVVLLGVGLASPAAADIYVCTDADGTATFSDRRLRGARCRLYAKTPKPPPGAAEAGQANGSTSAAGARPERFRPPGVASPRRTTEAVDEPADRADRERLYGPYIQEAAALYDIPEPFIRAIIRVESNFRYRAVSHKGAQGLMQLMPVTGREMGVTDPFDARQNILGGTRLLRVLANRYQGDIVQVLSAYCSGSGSVARADGATPSEAADSYVRAVLDYYYQYRALGPP